MKRSQLIVLGIGAGLFLLLSILPKTVVENDAIAIEGTGGAVEEAAGGEHMEPLTPAQRLSISLARRAFDEAPAELRRASLDTLLATFIAINRFDSAAHYAEAFAGGAQGQDGDWLKAADLYYEAFTYALSRPKASSMGGKARDIYESLLSKHYGSADTLRVKAGMTYTASDAPMQGILMIRGALEENPSNLFARKQLGLLSINSGQFEKAVGHFSELLAQQEDVESLYYLGIAYVQLDRHEEAKGAFERLKTLTDDPSILQTADQYLAELAEHQHD